MLKCSFPLSPNVRIFEFLRLGGEVLSQQRMEEGGHFRRGLRPGATKDLVSPAPKIPQSHTSITSPLQNSQDWDFCTKSLPPSQAPKHALLMWGKASSPNTLLALQGNFNWFTHTTFGKPVKAHLPTFQSSGPIMNKWCRVLEHLEVGDCSGGLALGVWIEYDFQRYLSWRYWDTDGWSERFIQIFKNSNSLTSPEGSVESGWDWSSATVWKNRIDDFVRLSHPGVSINSIYLLNDSICTWDFTHHVISLAKKYIDSTLLLIFSMSTEPSWHLAASALPWRTRAPGRRSWFVPLSETIWNIKLNSRKHWKHWTNWKRCKHLWNDVGHWRQFVFCLVVRSAARQTFLLREKQCAQAVLSRRVFQLAIVSRCLRTLQTSGSLPMSRWIVLCQILQAPHVAKSTRFCFARDLLMVPGSKHHKASKVFHQLLHWRKRCLQYISRQHEIHESSFFHPAFLSSVQIYLIARASTRVLNFRSSSFGSNWNHMQNPLIPCELVKICFSHQKNPTQNLDWAQNTVLSL